MSGTLLWEAQGGAGRETWRDCVSVALVPAQVGEGDSRVAPGWSDRGVPLTMPLHFIC